MTDVHLACLAELGLLRPGTRWYRMFVHPTVAADAPVLDALRAECAQRCAEETDLDPALAVVMYLSPDYLTDFAARRPDLLPLGSDPAAAFARFGVLFAVIPNSDRRPAGRRHLAAVPPPEESP